MELATRNFGVIVIEEEKVLSFPQGLFGFADAQRFCLIHKPEALPFHWLQSVDRPELCWVVLPLLFVRPDYRLALTAADRAGVNLGAQEDPLLLTVVVVADDPAQTTVNLLAPLVINEREQTGTQIINEGGGYRTQHVLRDELETQAKEGEDHAGVNAQTQAIGSAR